MRRIHRTPSVHEKQASTKSADSDAKKTKEAKKRKTESGAREDESCLGSLEKEEVFRSTAEEILHEALEAKTQGDAQAHIKRALSNDARDRR
jgi:hypothetical protein